MEMAESGYHVDSHHQRSSRTALMNSAGYSYEIDVNIPIGSSASRSDYEQGFCGTILTLFSYVIFICTFPFSLCFCLKVVQEYERAVIFRLGRLLPGGAKGPGMFFILPCIDNFINVDMRTISFDVPPQEILTKDSVTVSVDAVVYYRVHNAIISVTNVEDSARSTKLLAATTLRNVLGTKNLAEVLTDREHISNMIQSHLHEATASPWGIKVERVEVKDVRLPAQLQRAMAAEAEATREAKAKVMAAEGEQNASRGLKEAGDVLMESPTALQLRYLQTLNTISAEKNSTVVFPIPINVMSTFMPHLQGDWAGMPGGNAQTSGGGKRAMHGSASDVTSDHGVYPTLAGVTGHRGITGSGARPTGEAALDVAADVEKYTTTMSSTGKRENVVTIRV